MAVTTIGLDVAKDVFQVHGVDASGLAYDLAIMLWCENAQHTSPGFATPGQVVLVPPGGIAAQRERVQVQGEGVGVRTQQRRHGADPA